MNLRNLIWLQVLIVVCGTEAASGQENVPKQLNGVWKVVSGRLDVPFSDDPVVSIEVRGDASVARVGSGDQSRIYMYDFGDRYHGPPQFIRTINEPAMPLQIDLWVGGCAHVPGIYKLEDDSTLRIFLASQHFSSDVPSSWRKYEGARPTSFENKRTEDDLPRYRMVTLRRDDAAR